MTTSRWPISQLPIRHIEPFPYHKGEMYVDLLDRLAKYVTDQLHPNLRKTIEELIQELEQVLALQHNKYVQGVQDFQKIHDEFMEDVNSALMALNDEAVTDLVEDPGTSLGSAVREAIIEERDTIRRDSPQLGLFFPEASTGDNDAEQIQAAIDRAQAYGGTVKLQPRTYRLTATLRVRSNVTIEGVPDRTVLDVSGVGDGNYGIQAVAENQFTRFRLKGLNIVGSPTRRTNGVYAGGVGGFERRGITDFEMEHVRIELVNIGVKASYTWCGNFTLLRVHNSNVPLEFGSQANALHFDTCSFSSFQQPMRFVNSETVLFTNVNVVNGPVDDFAFLVNQSNLTFINPYFELLTQLARLGHRNDIQKPSFTTVGGRVCGMVQLNMEDVGLNIQNPWYVTMGVGDFQDDKFIVHARQRSGESPFALTRFYRVDPDKRSQPGVKTEFSWKVGQEWTLANAFHGSEPTITHTDDYTRFRVPSIQGISVPVELEPDTQYVLAMRVRRISSATSPTWIRLNSHRVESITLPSHDSDFVTQYIPIHSADGGVLSIIANSSDGFDNQSIGLDIQSIELTRGLTPANHAV